MCGAMVLATSCTEDYEDASSVHVYGPNECPPVLAGAYNSGSQNYEMNGGQADPSVLKIDDYAALFKDNFGVTVDELLAGLGKTFEVRVINPNRMVWLKNESNAGGEYSWWVSKTGNLCQADAENLYGKLEFNKAERQFEFYLNPDAGGTVSMMIGFVKDNGVNYNQCVRFTMTVTAFDKSFIFTDLAIPAGDYEAGLIEIADLAEAIQFTFGETVDQFAASINNGKTIYMIDHNANVPMWNATPTANSGGYWCNAEGEVISWGAGCAYYIEPWIDDETCAIGIGRYPGYDPGTVWNVRFAIVSDVDHSKMLTFNVTAITE